MQKLNHFSAQMRYFLECRAFGVCTRLGDLMGISGNSIRLFFIYTSFLMAGSPILVYLSMAFVMRMRRHARRYHQIVRGF
ncbi:MAG: PspC family transcriptional regulator [Bernardetiaceae bacterium]